MLVEHKSLRTDICQQVTLRKHYGPVGARLTALGQEQRQQWLFLCAGQATDRENAPEILSPDRPSKKDMLSRVLVHDQTSW